MWKELFKSVSKLFAADLSKGIINEKQNAQRYALKQSITVFNAVSDDFYKRNNFLNGLSDLSFEIVENILAETKDVDLDAELQAKLENYYYNESKDIQASPFLPLTGEPFDTYDKALISYNQATDAMRIFIVKRKAARKLLEQRGKYAEKVRKIEERLKDNRITEKEYQKKVELLSYIINNFEESEEVKDPRNFIELRNDALSHQEEFNRLGEITFTLLEEKLM